MLCRIGLFKILFRGVDWGDQSYSDFPAEIFLECVLILRNSSLKLKMIVDNANLPHYAVSPENIFERIKTKTENSFQLKRNVCKFR